MPTITWFRCTVAHGNSCDFLQAWRVGHVTYTVEADAIAAAGGEDAPRMGVDLGHYLDGEELDAVARAALGLDL